LRGVDLEGSKDHPYIKSAKELDGWVKKRQFLMTFITVLMLTLQVAWLDGSENVQIYVDVIY
jgi:hypothetical protein